MKNRSKSRTAANSPPPVRPKKRRVLWMTAISMLLVVIAISVDAPARFANSIATQRMLKLDNAGAEWWLGLSEKISSKNAETIFLQSRLARQSGLLDHMLELQQKAERLGFDKKKLQQERVLAKAQIGELDAVEDELKSIMQADGSDLADVCDCYSNGLTIRSRLDDAQAVLAAWEADYPEDPRPNLRRGLILEHQQNFVDAIKQYRLSVSKSSHFFKAWYALGRTLKVQREMDEAMEAFKKCYPLPLPYAAELGVAGCLREMGKNEEAKEIYKRLVNVEKTALAQSFRLVESQSDGDAISREYGMLLSTEGNYSAALPVLQTAIDVWPNDLEARYAFATSLRGMGENDRAAVEFEKIKRAREALATAPPLLDRLQRDPNDTDARLQLGVLHMEFDSARKGLYWLESILVYDETNAEALRLLSEYYEAHAVEDPTNKVMAERYRAKLNKVLTDTLRRI